MKKILFILVLSAPFLSFGEISEETKNFMEANNIPENCSIWFDGCNTCTKTENGFECTEIGCYPASEPAECLTTDEENGEKKIDKDINPLATTSNLEKKAPKNCSVWFDGCNTCKNIGGNFACTKKACAVEKDSYCEVFLDDENFKEPLDGPTDFENPKENPPEKIGEAVEEKPADKKNIFQKIWNFFAGIF